MSTTSSDKELRDVEAFLYDEAQLLDGWQTEKWFSLVTKDISYRIPIRTTLEGPALYEPGFSSHAFHMLESYETLEARVKRIATGDAWSETPPSRVRRHITCIRLVSRESDTYQVRSNLLLFWGRDLMSEIVSAERQDVLRRENGSLRLAQRIVLLDHTVLPLPAIPFMI